MPRVLSFINYKGGVGKTTTAYHVGCSLAQHHEQRVLMIDVDSQPSPDSARHRTDLEFVIAGRIVGSFAIRDEFDRETGPNLPERAFPRRVVESVAAGRLDERQERDS